jgi:hypothetical protein
MKFELAFRARIDLAPPVNCGPIQSGFRRIIAITGGEVSGPHLVGKVLPIGADWNVAFRNGTSHISARYLIETEDGVVISLLNEGIARISSENIESIAQGNPADPEGWYVRTHPQFEAPDGPYEWLNTSMFFCSMDPVISPEFLHLNFYELT